MNKILISIVVLIAFTGCATTENGSHNSLQSFDEEYERAVDTVDAVMLASNARGTSKIINDMRRFYGYQGQIYDRPVKNDAHIWSLEQAGIKEIGFPMNGSTQSIIFQDCIFDKFARETGLRPDQWFEISIKIYRNEDEFYKMNAADIYLFPDIYFIGIVKANGTMIGNILRKP